MRSISSILTRSFDFLLFSSIIISVYAVLMVVQTGDLLHLNYDERNYLLFVFFSTLASYNLHWYYTPHNIVEKQRSQWSEHNRNVHLFLLIASGIAAAWFGLKFIDHWLELGIAVVLTFLYSAPKLPFKTLQWLKKIAIGKTLFLAFVWTYVTTVLPILISETSISFSFTFCLARFFFIYAVCIIFDYRDREQDRLEGIRSMITSFSETGIRILFYASLILSIVLYMICRFDTTTTAILILPSLILPLLFARAKRDFSDYLYDFILDGMMAVSSLVTLLLNLYT